MLSNLHSLNHDMNNAIVRMQSILELLRGGEVIVEDINLLLEGDHTLVTLEKLWQEIKDNMKKC